MKLRHRIQLQNTDQTQRCEPVRAAAGGHRGGRSAAGLTSVWDPVAVPPLPRLPDWVNAAVSLGGSSCKQLSAPQGRGLAVLLFRPQSPGCHGAPFVGVCCFCLLPGPLERLAASGSGCGTEMPDPEFCPDVCSAALCAEQCCSREGGRQVPGSEPDSLTPQP